MAAINQSAPTKITGKVMSSHAIESANPSFEPAIVGIDVLNVINLGDHSNACSEIDRTVSDSHFPRGRTQRLPTVGAENDIACQERLESRADVPFVSLLKHEVSGTPRSITTNQYRNLFVRQTAFRCLSATLARRTSHALLLALERFKEKRLVRFGNADQAQGLLLIGQREKTMTPAEGCVAMNSTDFGAFANALPFSHLLRVVQPLVLVTQSCQRRSRQRIERGLACRATVSLQSRRRTPPRDVIMPTLGAHWSGQCATFNQGIDGLYVPDFLQTFRQKRSLVWRQFLKFFRQGLEFFSSHHCTYLTDSYGNSIGHYLTGT